MLLRLTGYFAASWAAVFRSVGVLMEGVTLPRGRGRPKPVKGSALLVHGADHSHRLHNLKRKPPRGDLPHESPLPHAGGDEP